MRKLRVALICMLMLALPVQGMAALGMQLCAATGQGEQGSQQMAAHHPGALMLEQHGHNSHGSHHASSNAQPVSPADNSLCSLCAFCVGAVAFTSVASSQNPPHVIESPLPRLDRFVGHIDETPERPPRLFLA
jgi:hypothetical protein